MKRFNSETEVKEFCAENREQITSIVNETVSRLKALPYNTTELEPALRPGRIRKIILQILLNSLQNETSSLLNAIQEQLYTELYKEIEPNAKEAKFNLAIGTSSLHTIREPKTAAEKAFNECFDDVTAAVDSLIPQINTIPYSQEADIAILCHLQSNVLDAIEGSNLSISDAVKENLLSSIRAEIELQKDE